MAKRGRKTKLTPEVQAQICSYVNAGAPLPHACVAAGISWNTCKDWMKLGKTGKQPYADFCAAVKQAKARWVAGATMRVTKASDRDWRAAAWLLERRTKEFRPRQKLEHSGPDEGPIRFQGLEAMSTEDMFKRVEELRQKLQNGG